MPALPRGHEQPPLQKLRQMAARRGWGDTGRVGQLGRGQRASVKQRHEHVGAAGIADQRCNLSDAQADGHGRAL